MRSVIGPHCRIVRLKGTLCSMAIAAALALPAALATTPVTDVHAQERTDISMLTVTGSGTAESAPDMAIITSGVISEGETVGEALAANSTSMQSILDALNGAGIEERDIQTTNFSIQPKYIYDRTDDGVDKPPQIVGYTVSNDVTVRIRDIKETGGLLDSVVSLGANQVRGIRFAVAEPWKLEDAARRAAVAEARAKAEAYTGAAGLTLGRILKMNEGGSHTPPPVPMAEARALTMSAPAVPIAGGEISYSAQITIVYELIEGE